MENRFITMDELREVLNNFKYRHISVSVANTNNTVVSFRRFENFKYKESFRKDDLIFKNYEDFDGKIYIKQDTIKEIYIEDFCGIDGYTIRLSDDTEVFLHDVDVYEAFQKASSEADD